MAKGKQKQDQSGRNQSASQNNFQNNSQNNAQNKNPSQSGENAKTTPNAK
jgi:hypothetical protein